MASIKITENSPLIKEWDYEKNENLSPLDCTERSHKKIWWKCELGHSWLQTIANRSAGCNCPYCSNRKILIGYNDLATTHPEIAQEWDYKKNDKEVTPENVVSGSKRKIHWICKEKHRWIISIENRATKGSGCPYCSGRIAIEGIDDLATTNPKIAETWHPTKNILKPNQVKVKSNRKIWWMCEKKHEWQTTVYNRWQGKGCPYCSNNKILIGYNDFPTIHPELFKEWNFNKNTIDPYSITGGATKNIWWICSEKHEWEQNIGRRTKKKSLCPTCSYSNLFSVQEKELFNFIKNLLPPEFEIKENSRKVIFPQEVDIFIPELNLGIEYNGLYWHSDKGRKGNNYHFEKWEKCYDKGIHLITVWEDDWNFKKDLKKNIEQLIEIKQINKKDHSIDEMLKNKFVKVLKNNKNEISISIENDFSYYSIQDFENKGFEIELFENPKLFYVSNKKRINKKPTQDRILKLYDCGKTVMKLNKNCKEGYISLN